MIEIPIWLLVVLVVLASSYLATALDYLAEWRIGRRQPAPPPAEPAHPETDPQPERPTSPRHSRTVTFNRKATGEAGRQNGQVDFPDYPTPHQ